METIEYFAPKMSYNRNRWSKSTQSYFIRSKSFRKSKHSYFGKVFKPKEQLIPFPCFSLLGGNRKDPLNLNELIQKKKNSTTTTNSIHGNDRQVEILLQPNIFDPLCLDISSYSNQTNLQQVSKPMNEY